MEKKVILITGASSGIGYSAARILSQQGHKVYGAARRVELMEPLREFGLVPVKLDVTDENSIREAVKTVIEAEGRIDVLVNNAGYGSFGPIESVPEQEARMQMEVNVFGLAAMIRCVLPYMRERHGGRIINISSIAGKLVLPYGGWYHVSKYSVEALSDALRIELKQFGIKVSIIEPGGIKTPWGTIAAEHLEKTCEGTVYEDEGGQMARFLRKGYATNILSSPDVIGRAIARAANARRPKTRYRTGRIAGTAVFVHSIIPARWWDALMKFSVKNLYNLARRVDEASS